MREIVTGLVVAAEWAYRANLRRSHDYLVAQKARAIEEQRRREEEAAKKERARIALDARKRREALVDIVAGIACNRVEDFDRARMCVERIPSDRCCLC